MARFAVSVFGRDRPGIVAGRSAWTSPATPKAGSCAGLVVLFDPDLFRRRRYR